MARPTHPTGEEEEEEEEEEPGPTESGSPELPEPPASVVTNRLTAATADVGRCWILVVALAGRVEYSTLATLEPAP